MLPRPQSCLGLIEERFKLLMSSYRPLTLSGTSLRDIRIQLLRPRISPHTKEAIWANLVHMAHAQPEPWISVAAGMMIPGLKSIGARLGLHYGGDRRDLDSAIMEGFLAGLTDADPTKSTPYIRLYHAALRCGYRECVQESGFSRKHFDLTGDIPNTIPCHRTGNPDLVLADAMLNGVLTPHQAELISEVRLDHGRRQATARRLGTTRRQVSAELATAERRLARYLIAA